MHEVLLTTDFPGPNNFQNGIVPKAFHGAADYSNKIIDPSRLKVHTYSSICITIQVLVSLLTTISCPSHSFVRRNCPLCLRCPEIFVRRRFWLSRLMGNRSR